MKMNRICLSIIFTLFLVAGMKCSDGNDDPEPEPQLPDITQEGKGTLGFLKNDSVWLPESPKSVWPELFCVYQSADSVLKITASIYNSNGDLMEAMYLAFSPVGGSQKEFTLSHHYKNRGYFEYGYDPGYATNNLYTGKVNLLKFDKTNYIVAGTFNFNAIDTTSGDTIVIKEGRFDLIYY